MILQNYLGSADDVRRRVWYLANYLLVKGRRTYLEFARISPRLRKDEQQRLGSDFSLGRFHDRLLYAGSIPISYHRRLLQEEATPA